MLSSRQKWQIDCYPKWLQKILYLRYRWLRVLLIILCITPFIPIGITVNTLYKMYQDIIDNCTYMYQDCKTILSIANRKGN